MNIYDYKRAVCTLGDISLEDQAVVVCRMTKDGQIVTRNMGDSEARKKIYATLRVLPATTDSVESTVREEANNG